MSACLFIASDIPMEIIKNPHIMELSINQAKELGIEIPKILLDSKVDPDIPDTIFIADFDEIISEEKIFDKDADDDFALHIFESVSYYCDMPYGVYIECNYFTEGRVKKIIDYIKNIMAKTNCVEIWNVWLSKYEHTKVNIIEIKIDELQAENLYKLKECSNFDDSEDNYNIVTHYCLKITK